MGVEMYVSVAILGLLAVGLLLVIHGTIVRNNWGVNFHRVRCSNCSTLMSPVRMPTSRRQAIWGGYTCPACHCELDKWGRDIARPD